MVGTIRYNNGVRSNSVTPAVAGVEQERAILRCMSVGTIDVRLQKELDLMFMKHYAPNRCLYIKVAKLRTGVGSTETSYLQNCSVKLFKEHFKVQICKGRLFQKNKITFFLIFTN